MKNMVPMAMEQNSTVEVIHLNASILIYLCLLFRWLYLKVPLSTSCPLSRTWIPSLSKEPKAMYSPRAQSQTLWVTMSARPFRILRKPETWTQRCRWAVQNVCCIILKTKDAAGHTLPACMVKSGTGTEAATPPMWRSISSLMPVEGQLMLLGRPSCVKKPTKNQKQWLQEKWDETVTGTELKFRV